MMWLGLKGDLSLDAIALPSHRRGCAPLISFPVSQSLPCISLLIDRNTSNICRPSRMNTVQLAEAFSRTIGFSTDSALFQERLWK